MIKKIVLTGGPGTGKTTVLEKIKQVYEPLGYKVLIIDETATYLITNGIKPFGDDAIDIVDFQELVMRMQLAKEQVFEKAVAMMGEDTKSIIVYDRGTIDNTAYINQEQFEEVLARLNHVKSFADLMNNYDLVIDLIGRKDFYTTENNTARSEDADYALELGANTLRSWIGHNKIKIVGPKDTMDEKLNEVLNIINETLSETPVKRQEKFLVDLQTTDLDTIKRIGKSMRITQDYLQCSPDVEKRIRKIEFNGCTSYYFSVFKIDEAGTKKIVSEKGIDKKVYDHLMSFKDESSKTVTKTRYYFTDNDTYYSLDVFDGNDEFGIMEINVGEKEKVTVPEFVSALENVTKDPAYQNRNISKRNYKVYEKK